MDVNDHETDVVHDRNSNYDKNPVVISLTDFSVDYASATQIVANRFIVKMSEKRISSINKNLYVLKSYLYRIWTQNRSSSPRMSGNWVDYDPTTSA